MAVADRNQIVLEKGIPFPVRIPNEETVKVLKEVREVKNIESLDLNSLVSEAKESVEPEEA